MNTSLDLMECTQLLGIHISNDIANRNITSIIHKFYAKVNSIMYDFRNVLVMSKQSYYLLIV